MKYLLFLLGSCLLALSDVAVVEKNKGNVFVTFHYNFTISKCRFTPWALVLTITHHKGVL